MSDDLILICLILVLRHKVLNTGKRDLVDVLVDLFLCHAKAVVLNGNGLFIWIYTDLDLVFYLFRFLILSH